MERHIRQGDNNVSTCVSRPSYVNFLTEKDARGVDSVKICQHRYGYSHALTEMLKESKFVCLFVLLFDQSRFITYVRITVQI